MDMDSLRQEKIQRFEDFVDHRLKPDLIKAIGERDKVFEKQKNFLDLKRNLENLEKNSVTSLRTMINLGSEVYMQADVPDTSRIFVDIGLGFHVEFTWSEALKFIAVRGTIGKADRGVYTVDCINQSADQAGLRRDSRVTPASRGEAFLNWALWC